MPQLLANTQESLLSAFSAIRNAGKESGSKVELGVLEESLVQNIKAERVNLNASIEGCSLAWIAVKYLPFRSNVTEALREEGVDFSKARGDEGNKTALELQIEELKPVAGKMPELPHPGFPGGKSSSPPAAISDKEKLPSKMEDLQSPPGAVPSASVVSDVTAPIRPGLLPMPESSVPKSPVAKVSVSQAFISDLATETSRVPRSIGRK